HRWTGHDATLGGNDEGTEALLRGQHEWLATRLRGDAAGLVDGPVGRGLVQPAGEITVGHLIDVDLERGDAHGRDAVRRPELGAVLVVVERPRTPWSPGRIEHAGTDAGGGESHHARTRRP